MNSLFKVNIYSQAAYKQNWSWFLTWGIILVILGFLAITFSIFTSIITMIVLGAMLTIGGVILTIDSFHFWRRNASNFFMHLGIGLLYVIVGIMLVATPVRSALSLTLILAIFFIIIGVIRIVQSFSHEVPDWSWRLINGIVALVMGILIIAQWPASGVFIIGLFVGIELLVTGWVYIFAALAAHKKIV